MNDALSLLTVVGPTGVGKTALAVRLAKKLGAELVSVDSRQVYIGMDIGTGKGVDEGQWEVRDGEKVLVIKDVPVHGLDLVRPDEPFSAADWLEKIGPVIAGILGRGLRPVLVGGTGFYLEALQGKVASIAVPPDQALRAELAALSVAELYHRLQDIDAKRAEQLNESDRQNRVRLVRAVEIALGREKGDPSTLLRTGGIRDKGERGGDYPLSLTPYPLVMLGLAMERRELYRRVDERVERMVEQGLVAETRSLLEHYAADLPSLSGIGYREMEQYLARRLSLAEAKQQMKWRTHAYIRRQETWFKRLEVNWVQVEGEQWVELAEREARRLLGL